MARLPRTLEDWIPWIVGGLWALLPLTAGGVLGDALDGASGPVRLVASGGLWLGWAAGVVATLIPHAVSLTATRVLAPAALAAVVGAAAAGHFSALAAGWVPVAAAWTFAPAWGTRCVNGPAYPNERRFLLRAPAPLLLGPLPLAWALMAAGTGAGPLLLAARRWGWGAAALAVGGPLAVVLARGVHNLSRRWAVFVPAGVVLHDPITLAEPVLLPRATVARLGPAFAGASDALDLTQRAYGLVLEVRLSRAASLNLLRPPRREAEGVESTALRITPTRPGLFLDEARRRRFAVG